MAFYTTLVEQEDRPNLRNQHNVWAVCDDMDDSVIAYCLSSNKAEHVKACLVYANEHFPGFVKDVQERVEVPPCSVCGKPAVTWKSGGSSAACADHRDGLDMYFR